MKKSKKTWESVQKTLIVTAFRMLAASVVLAQVGLAQVIIPVEKGTFTLTVTDAKPTVVGNILVNFAMEGTIRNDTAFDYMHLYLELIGYDAGGQDVKMCDRFNVGLKCELHIFDPIPAGQSVQFKFPGNLISPDAMRMQKAVRSVYRVVEAPYRVKYKVDPSPFVSEKFTVLPWFDTRGIVLEFRSSSDVVEVLWDQSVYIDEAGNASRLIRSNVRLIEKDRPQPNTVVPPGTRLRETVFPVDRVKQDKDGSLYQEGLFPEIVENGSSDRAALSFLVGKEVRLFLRLLVNDQKQSVTIPFKVVRVEY